MRLDFEKTFNNEYDKLVEQAGQATFFGYDMKEIVQYGTTNDILFVIQMICNQYNDMLKRERNANSMIRDIKDAHIRSLGG